MAARPERLEVAVIGAGLAGLTAARALREAGVGKVLAARGGALATSPHRTSPARPRAA